MWTLKEPEPVKLFAGILAADARCMQAGHSALIAEYGGADLISDQWQFNETDYYCRQTGTNIIRQFLSFERLIDPSQLAAIKHRTNDIEQQLAGELAAGVPRPVNIDPGYIEPSKLVLASTKNFSHRIYIGSNIWAEVTLIYSNGWSLLPWTYPDYRLTEYHRFFERVRMRLVEQKRQSH
jgi:hypothetical protein